MQIGIFNGQEIEEKNTLLPYLMRFPPRCAAINMDGPAAIGKGGFPVAPCRTKIYAQRACARTLHARGGGGGQRNEVEEGTCFVYFCGAETCESGN